MTTKQKLQLAKAEAQRLYSKTPTGRTLRAIATDLDNGFSIREAVDMAFMPSGKMRQQIIAGTFGE